MLETDFNHLICFEKINQFLTNSLLILYLTFL